MKKETFKKSYYIVLALLILIFYTKDINISKEFYHNIKTITNQEDILVLVNKNNKLDKNYIPKLEKLDTSYSNDNKFLRKEAKEAFEKL